MSFETTSQWSWRNAFFERTGMILLQGNNLYNFHETSTKHLIIVEIIIEIIIEEIIIEEDDW